MLDRTAPETVADEIDERTLESALAFEDANPGTEGVVVTMGQPTFTARIASRRGKVIK